jgi:hypothetical protein
METEEISRPPRFANEAEEADWWAANPDFVLREFDRAKAEGRLGHGTVKRRMEAMQAAKEAALRLDPADVALANQLAQRKGLEREVYLRELVHAALVKEAESLDRSPAA